MIDIDEYLEEEGMAKYYDKKYKKKYSIPSEIEIFSINDMW